MHRPLLRLILTLSLLLLGPTFVRADLIDYTYTWKITPADGKVYAGNHGGYVLLYDEQATDVTGATNVIATNLTTVSTAPAANPDKFSPSQGAYGFYVTLFDGPASGSLYFSGQLGGNFSSRSSNVDNIFTSGTVQTISLNGHDYVVTLTNFIPPGAPGSNNKGSINAYINVVQQLPEPSTMALAGLGFSFSALAAWRKRRGKAKI